MRLPDGAWHLALGIVSGVKHGRGLDPHAWPAIYFNDEVGTVDYATGRITLSKPKHASDGFWPRTSASLALAIRESEVVARIEKNGAWAKSPPVTVISEGIERPDLRGRVRFDVELPEDASNFRIGMTEAKP